MQSIAIYLRWFFFGHWELDVRTLLLDQTPPIFRIEWRLCFWAKRPSNTGQCCYASAFPCWTMFAFFFSNGKRANVFVPCSIFQIDRSGKIPMLRFRDRESYAGNKTKEYDDLAMKYLSYLLFFLVICFSIYSLMYERHKSWYSWILSSLTSCVYMFGKYLSFDFLKNFSSLALHFVLLKYSPVNIFVPVCIWIACGYSHCYLKCSNQLEKSSNTYFLLLFYEELSFHMSATNALCCLRCRCKMQT